MNTRSSQIPREVKLLFPTSKQKKAWEAKLVEKMNLSLQDSEEMVIAVNRRQSITKLDSVSEFKACKDFDAAELQLALAAIEAKDETLYRLELDGVRVLRSLSDIGFTQNIIDSLKLSLSDCVKYEAVYWAAMQDVSDYYDHYSSKMDQRSRCHFKDEYLIADKDALQTQLNQVAKSIIDLQIAKKAIASASNIGETNNSLLKQAARNVLNVADNAMNAGLVTTKELPALAKFLQGTADVVNNPSPENIKAHTENTKKAVGIHRRWGRLMSGAMLCFLGAALISTSILFAVGTFFTGTPISALGIALGGSMISAGITLGAAASVGAGVSAVSGFFANKARKGEIALAGEEVTKEAKKESKHKSRQAK